MSGKSTYDTDGYFKDYHHYEVKYHKVDRVAEDTISGLDLKVREVNMISEIVHFLPSESIQIIYLSGGNFEPTFKIEGNTIVGVTNFRIFKIEKSNVDSVMIKDILKVTHEKNGLLRWDKVVCTTTNGKTETFGIFYSKTCEYFCNHLIKLITPKN